MALIKDGYFQDTYWPSRYWQEDYWPEYGITAAAPATLPRASWSPRRRTRLNILDDPELLALLVEFVTII